MKKIKTYQRFFAFLLAWLDRSVESLVIVGAPGVGKSWAVKTLLEGRRHHWFSARQSALEIYKRIHDDPHIPVVFDDVSSLLRDDTTMDMMKNLCERGVSTLRWGTDTPKLGGRPKSFQCAAPVLILLNRVPARNPDLLAVLDRCHNFEFRPTKQQVIAYMRSYFPDDGELIDLLEEMAITPSVRTLMLARDWARSPGIDLHQELLEECGVPDSVVALIDIMERFPQDEWLDRYVQATGQTDRQFRRNRHLAMQVLACRGSDRECPNVRLIVPEPPEAPPIRVSDMHIDGGGQTDIRNPLLDLPERLRWLTDPESN